MDRMTAAWVMRVASRKPSGRWAKGEWIVWPDEIEPDTWYRTVFYADDHLSDPRFSDLALCGRSIVHPHADAVYEAAARLGNPLQSLIYLSQRKGGKCSQCKTMWENDRKTIEKEAREMQAAAQSERDEAERLQELRVMAARKNLKRRVRVHQDSIAVTLLRRKLGATVVEVS